MFRSRMLASFGLTAGAALCAALALSSAAAAQSVTGVWLDDEGKGAVELAECGDKLCGRIVWLKNPLNPQGKPWTDLLNPDESKRSQPICGLQVIGDLKKKDANSWEDGWIYDPEEGKTYKLEVKMKDPKTLSVRGFVLVTLLGETMQWTRLAADAPRCK